MPTYTYQQLDDPQIPGVAADWDGDGDIDGLAYVDGALSLNQRQEGGTYVSIVAGPPSGKIIPISAHDLDLDGDPDIVSYSKLDTGQVDAIYWQLNDGTGHFGQIKSVPLPATLAYLYPEDLNRDGDPDFVVGFLSRYPQLPGALVLLNDGKGDLSVSMVMDGSGIDTGGSSAAADIDGDDDLDLIMPIHRPRVYGILRIYRNQGNGTFVFDQDLNVGGYSPTVAVADFDDDGDIDLIDSSSSGSNWTLVVLSNDGAGHFQKTAETILTAAVYESLIVADMNGDSAPDVVTTDRMTVLLNDGTGQFATQFRASSTSGGHWYSVDDYDGDGRRDIIYGLTGWHAGGYADTTRPAVSRPSLVYSPQAGPPAVRVDFSEDVRQSLQVSDAQIVNLSTGQPIPVSDLKLDYSAGDIASWLLPNSLPDGNYRLILPASSVSDIAHNTLVSDFTYDFYILTGDANRDRVVDAKDLGVLSSNWQGTGKSFSQGDFNYDGRVDINDLYVVASKWQTALAPPPPPLPALPASSSLIARRAPTRIASTVL